MKQHNKLIRDNIPQIIAQAGKRYAVETLDETAYKEALRQKLVEEAQEVAQANEDEIIKELADLFEVITSILEVYSIDRPEIIKEQEKIRQARGGFQQRLKLLWTD